MSKLNTISLNDRKLMFDVALRLREAVHGKDYAAYDRTFGLCNNLLRLNDFRDFPTEIIQQAASHFSFYSGSPTFPILPYDKGNLHSEDALTQASFAYDEYGVDSDKYDHNTEYGRNRMAVLNMVISMLRGSIEIQKIINDFSDMQLAECLDVTTKIKSTWDQRKLNQAKWFNKNEGICVHFNEHYLRITEVIMRVAAQFSFGIHDAYCIGLRGKSNHSFNEDLYQEKLETKYDRRNEYARNRYDVLSALVEELQVNFESRKLL